MKNLRIALLFGGPSPERGISLNSARTVSDHLSGDGVEIVPIYFDELCAPYKLSREWLYSNTPSDFDFKIHQSSTPLSHTGLLSLLRRCDVAFPAIHGEFGEDGQIQTLLSAAKIPFIGSTTDGCELAYDKGTAQQLMAAHGYPSTGGIVIATSASAEKAFKKLRSKAAIIKPTRGGSSLGVRLVKSSSEAQKVAQELLATYAELIVEPLLQGTEFTVVVTQSERKESKPVALIPIEVETGGALFDFRRKYLATRQAVYHCPPRFDLKTIDAIRSRASELFALFGLRDIARLDGWLTKQGKILFTDINPISGMEQNSFLFIQGSRLGFSHRDLLSHLVVKALGRSSAQKARAAHALFKRASANRKKQEIPILFGGDTAERQVSVLSGTNAWLKLTRSHRYMPKPYLLDTNRDVWELPYSCALNHTAEDIQDACERFAAGRNKLASLAPKIIAALGFSGSQKDRAPQRTPLQQFLKKKKFVFLGLHGGFGEGGELQSILELQDIGFNGPRSAAAHLAMDKYATGAAIEALKIKGVSTASKIPVETTLLLELSDSELAITWKELQSSLGKTILVKPKDDGCSSGIVVLRSAKDFSHYLSALRKQLPRIEAGTLSGQATPVELPPTTPQFLLFESFIVTDHIEVRDQQLHLTKQSGWVEVTVAVLGARNKMKALPPSITVAQGGVLSVEEKFQGGTGINLTPPPQNIMSAKVTKLVRNRIAQIANRVGLEGYSRIDAFVERRTGKLIIIEINTLPALTPATVLFHQALMNEQKMYPLELLEKLIALGSKH